MVRKGKLFILATSGLLGCVLGFHTITEGSGRNIELRYAVKVKDIPSTVNKVAIWIPVPRSNSIQHLEDVRLSTAIPSTILTDEEYGNRFLYTEISRRRIRDSEFSLIAVFRIYRQHYKNRKFEDDLYQEAGRALNRFLSPARLIPVERKIAEEAYTVTKGISNPLLQARMLFNHIVETMGYDKSGERWGRGDALYAYDVRRGNCTDFHSLFIGEIRALGIPARFIIGFPLTSEVKSGIIPGYHCWAEFYIEENGWIPLDATEAKKNWKEKEKYFGNLDENRISFTIGRGIRLPRAHTDPLNYVIYPYVEVDRKAYAKIET